LKRLTGDSTAVTGLKAGVNETLSAAEKAILWREDLLPNWVCAAFFPET
jgi:hypothetical protein